jgi:CheY-like chemotaxis protein
MKETKFRNTMFTALFLVVGSFLLYMAVNDPYDTTMVVGFVTLFFISFCLGLCFWWMVASRNPSSMMFKINVALFFSNFYFVAWATYSRYVSLYNLPDYYELRSSDVWAFRFAPMLVVFIWLFSWIVARVLGSEYSGKSAMTQTKLKVLIVDDEPSICSLMENIIASLDIFEVVCCNTSECAESVFKPDEYVCVVLDMRLAEGVDDGIVLAEYIRKQDPYVFIGVVTGYFNEIALSRIMLVVDDFLQKPFDLSTFRLKVLLWTIQYRERLLLRSDFQKDSYFQSKRELLSTIDSRLKNKLSK